DTGNVTVQTSDAVDDHVAHSVKEKTITPDVAHDVGASIAQTNPNDATITESFGDNSDYEGANEEEVGQDDLEIEDS
ncbi:hypothetical protein A2U01_0097876, partial [Trifolium medium]|nr:hypothetical protein [Trifolium medium]